LSVPKTQGRCRLAAEQRAERGGSLDHLVGEQLDRVRHINAERPDCLQVNDEFEFGRNREIGGCMVDFGIAIKILQRCKGPYG